MGFGIATVRRLTLGLGTIFLLIARAESQQVTGQDLDTILERADKILEEAKAAYEEAKSKDSVQAFVEAGFKLEECRIKYIVLQEIGSPEKQKIASDRLRAVNQLSKLIHDGKVAISGTPAETPTAKSPEPAKPDPVPPEPPKPPAVGEKPSDSLSRAAVPAPQKQQEAEKLIKDLFKEQYAKKASADRQLLSKLLLEQAAKTSNDPGALWVLYREAQDAAVQACDVPLITASIERAARVFDVDALQLKLNALTSAGKAAKTPTESASVAEALLKLVDDLIAADLYDAAEKAVNQALQSVKRTSETGLANRAATISKEVSEAKTRYQSMKSVLQTLAKNPDDPGANNETGQFLCFVKGSWDLGLRFIVKGSDPILKEIARKELNLQPQPADQASLADAWADLSEKEKSPLRKSQLVAHSRALYQAALAGGADGLLKAKIEKRMGEVGAATKRPPIDLLKLVDPEKDSTKGKWKLAGGALLSPDPGLGQLTTLQVPYEPPEEYDLTVGLERKSGTNYFLIGLASGRTRFCFVIDAWPLEGGLSGLQNMDGQNLKGNETAKKGFLAPLNKPITVVCMVRRSSITVTVDGKTVVDWKSNFDRLSLDRSEGPIFFDGWEASMRISKITLVPLGTDGRRLR